jgi:hypothetical protein
MNQDNGGIIGKLNTPTTSVASGVWTLQDQFEAQTSSIWPLAFPQITIANSCRFNGSSDTLTRTPSSETNRKTFTISSWVKFSATESMLFSVGADTNNRSYIILTSDNIVIENRDSGTKNVNLITNRKFRDYSAWYHILLSVDTTQSTDSDRVKLYVNGVQETSFSTETYPSQNQDFDFNTASIHYIGRNAWSSGNFMNGYLAEVVMIDGTALDPTSFGAFNPVTNIWEPRGYAGTYGTNGFRLDFANSSALGNDVSGNDNDFTVNNLTSIDQSTDTCSNNFATMNPLDNYYASSTFSEGNTKIVTDASAKAANTSTFGISSGKWYCEIKAVQIYNGYAQFGIKGTVPTSTTDGVGDGTDGYAYTASGGNKVNGGSASSYGTVWNNNDIIGIAIDLDNNKLYFSRNGSFQDSGDPTSGSTGTGAAFSLGTPSSGAYYIATSDGDTSGGSANTYEFNFGNSPFTISSGNADANGFGNFEYAVPSGYFSLCTKNLAEFG